MDLNELYKEIEKAEIDLNAKRLKYIKEALVENGGSIKLKFKKWGGREMRRAMVGCSDRQSKRRIGKRGKSIFQNDVDWCFFSR